MTPELEGGEWSAARPGHTLPPGKTRYPIYRRLGGPQGRSDRVENLVPTGIRSRTVQPVAQSLYRLSYRAHINENPDSVFIKLRCKAVSVYRLAQISETTEDFTVLPQNFRFFRSRPKPRI